MAGKKNLQVMGRNPRPKITVHRLSAGEQRVLASFIAGRLPAGQVCAELERARVSTAVTVEPPPAVQPQPVPAVAA